MDRWITIRIWALLSAFALSTALIDIQLEDRQSGYFLKPLFGGQSAYGPTDQESHFVVTQARGQVKVKAEYGPYKADAVVSPEILAAALGNQSSLLSNTIVDDMDVSAHLVTRSITQERPQLQVLFHASQINNPKSRNTKTAEKAAKGNIQGKWCMQVHARKGEQELSAVCILERQRRSVCVAHMDLPVQWWDPVHTQSADVLYSVYSISENLQCSSSTNSIATHNGQGLIEEADRVKSYVGAVTLTHGQMTFQEVQEDQHILVYVPQKSFYPGTQFRVPIKLQAESDLQVFVVRVKARHGLKIIGASAKTPSRWSISVDTNPKRRGAMVTAFVNNRDHYTPTDKVQEIFEWIFEVEDDAGDEDPGRIVLSLEYEMDSKNKESYGSTENRVVAQVHIQHDNVFTIVPVIKTTELVNTAILTGQTQSWSLRIYSLTQSGYVTDITSQTTCHSGQEDVLKVAQSCNLVYLDGSETQGSASVSVIAKYGRHTKFLFFKVWTPEFPLNIDLADSRLSQIKGWKAPQHARQRITRGAEFGLLTHPGLLHQEESSRPEDFTTTCHLRFQQTQVEVYAHFRVPDDSKNQFLVHKKAQIRVTDLVKDKLRIADTSIATLSGTVVEGVSSGRTEVQVLSRLGRVIGAREVKVGNNKVSIERLNVDVVTGLEMDVHTEATLPGTLVAHLTRKEKLTKKYQEGVLDVSVQFGDGSVMPLRQLPPKDYFLDVDTLNNHVVAFGRPTPNDQPRIIALGQGKGELLKLSLELGDACQKKKSRPLAVSYVYIDVDFSKQVEEELQSDGHYPYENRANGRNTESDKEKNKQEAIEVKPQSPDAEEETDKHDELMGAVPVDESFLSDMDLQGQDVEVFEPSHEAQQQHVSETRGMSALEIGMYVLLGVFCLAITVFIVNCMVFVWRYQKKRVPFYTEGQSVQNANDWVWIGKATLERNSINTGCSQTLMPEADFNGNRNAPGATSTLHPQSGSTSARSSGVSGSGGSGSNRNSYVSTYKGSECSIRITSNPHPEANPGTSKAADGASTPAAATTTTAAPPPPTTPKATTEQLQRSPLNDDDIPPIDGEDLTDDGEDQEEPLVPPPVPPHAPRPPPPPHAGDGANPPSGECFDWDYEQMGMTYDQLMDYFDNLKESTA